MVTIGNTGFGFTVIKKLLVDEHKLLVTVTFTVPLICEAVLFIALKAAMGLDVPLAPSPMLVLVFVQLKLLLAMELIKLNGPTFSPPHTNTFAGKVAIGTSLIVIGVLAVVVPHSLVTASEIVYEPDVA